MKSPFRTRRARVLATVGLAGLILIEAVLLLSFWPERVEAASGGREGARGAGPAHAEFDLSNASIPVAEILAGGPPKDGIPAIDQPRFVSADQATFLRDDDVVIGLTSGGVARAYPLRILVWHEIVNDTLGDDAVSVTYCPLCGTAMVFDRRIDGELRSFGVSGLLYQSDVLMYDRETHSLWSQLAMKAVAGPAVGRELRWLPSTQTTWKAWREVHPETDVLSTETGFARDYARQPYDGYERMPGTMFPVPTHREDLPGKAWVAGLVIGGKAKAYALASIPDGEWIEDRIGGVEVRVRHTAEARRFEAQGPEGEAIPVVQAFWFAWQAFYPESALQK